MVCLRGALCVEFTSSSLALVSVVCPRWAAFLLHLHLLLLRTSTVVECSSQSHGDRLRLMPHHGTKSSLPTSLGSSSDGLPPGHHHDTGDTRRNMGTFCVRWLCGGCGGCFWLCWLWLWMDVVVVAVVVVDADIQTRCFGNIPGVLIGTQSPCHVTKESTKSRRLGHLEGAKKSP